jgi:cleavage and polyadenylation specificity factor subunit 1
MPPLFDEKFEIRLINTADWQTTDSYELMPEEVGTVSRLFLKTSESDYAEVKQYPFIVLVTSTIRGEDASCKGRICVFEINKESSAGSAPVSKLNLLLNKEQKGPVSACTAVDGTLSVAVGQKIYFWQLKNKRDLDMVGFHDTQFLVTNMVAVKKFLIVTDIYDSIFFMRWRDRVRTCDHLGKDSDHMGATAAGFMIDHEKMSMLIADGKNNINMYAYDPKNLATQKGQKLLCLGNFHMGTYTAQFVRVKLNRLNFPALGNQFARYGCLSGASDGSVSLFAPINADKFKRLGKLEIRLVSTLPHFCGLNPKAFRLWKPRWHYTHNHQRRFLDGNLLWKFAELDRATQESLASFAGVSVDELLDDMMELELATRLF